MIPTITTSSVDTLSTAINSLVQSLHDIKIDIAVEGMYSEYDGQLDQFWMVDENPDKVQLMDMKRISNAKKTGYHNTEGWVSYRGRLLKYPRSYSDRRVVYAKKNELRELYKLADKGAYVILNSDVFYEHPNKKYSKGMDYKVFVNASKWNNMTDEARWNYLRDLSIEGYSVTYSDRKKLLDEAAKRLEDTLKDYYDMCIHESRVPPYLAKRDVETSYTRALDYMKNPKRFERVSRIIIPGIDISWMDIL